MTQPTVLIIDDEPDILELLEMTLGRMDLLTRRASSFWSLTCAPRSDLFHFNAILMPF